ncbi:hypothetical protein NIIDMKKI_57970 [Mycobacterium kansasii]|uniref:Uncharacterized protein n=1 Tax=Mycobacterium kansasii TaxID=1768 RepID=A0A7G1IHY0_MYCKA|nr:hypothetical protein NIIDMKKI_57970 [Mycobacterium kansasii]
MRACTKVMIAGTSAGNRVRASIPAMVKYDISGSHFFRRSAEVKKVISLRDSVLSDRIRDQCPVKRDAAPLTNVVTAPHRGNVVSQRSCVTALSSGDKAVAAGRRSGQSPLNLEGQTQLGEIRWARE